MYSVLSFIDRIFSLRCYVFVLFSLNLLCLYNILLLISVSIQRDPPSETLPELVRSINNPSVKPPLFSSPPDCFFRSTFRSGYCRSRSHRPRSCREVLRGCNPVLPVREYRVYLVRNPHRWSFSLPLEPVVEKGTSH